MKNEYVSDPFFGKNILGAAAEFPSSATFSAKVELSDTDFKKKFVYLKLSGVTAMAEVFFNGKSQGILNNPNKSYVFDITDRALSGENTLLIKCSSPILRRSMLNSSGEVSEDYETAPVLPDIAILSKPEILMTDSALVSGVSVREEFEVDKVNVFVKPSILGSEDDIRVVASLMSPSGKIYFGGMSEDGVKITVPDPELWWPRGFGAPSLYKLTVTLYHGADVADAYEKRIGLRKIELEQKEGEAPRLLVNGVSVFSRGGAYVRSNSVLSDVTEEETEHLVSSVVNANMNTLTVLDEGMPISEKFYDLCDSKGILIWHSLTVPYIAPPAAGVFAAGLTDAIADTLKKLALHPSVAILFLNFEKPQANDMRIYPDALEEFRAVTMRIIAPLLNANASDVVFIENSDALFSYDERYSASEKMRSGYAKIYSLPTELTMETFTYPKDNNLFSDVVELHTASRESCLNMLINVSEELRFPSGMSELIYATELSAALKISRSVKAARRQKSGVSSAVLRQLNDGWQAVSSSMVDFFGRSKAVMHFAKKFCAPVTVSAVACENKMEFEVINGTKKEFTGKLVYALYDSIGNCAFEMSKEIVAEASSTSISITEDFSKYLSKERNTHFLAYELYDAKGIVSNGTELFVPVKHFKFEDPEINAEISGSGKKFLVKLTASSFVYAARVSFDGIDAAFSDNFVDIIPGTPTVVSFDLSDVATLGELRQSLKIITPYSMGK